MKSSVGSVGIARNDEQHRRETAEYRSRNDQEIYDVNYRFFKDHERSAPITRNALRRHLTLNGGHCVSSIVSI